jgi:tetratricopeptide (TPR) repeat protein
LGESGTSKTTLLMEVLCYCFDIGYTILYNLGKDSLRNVNTIVTKIKDLAHAENNVLIVIDDVQSAKLSLIFDVIYRLQTLNKNVKDKIHFLLAARQPEFNWISDKNLWGDANAVQTIEELFDDNYKFSIPYFTTEEIKEFIVKYKDLLYVTRRKKTVEENANDIFKDTNGYPIMVRFSVLNEGLEIHVKEMYREYLLDKNNNYPNLNKIKTIILNSLFDISNISLKDELLEEFSLLSIAKKELNNTIIKKTGDVWKTIHPKWDMELLRYILSLEYILDDIVNSFKYIIRNIISNEKIIGFDKVHILFTVYYIFIKERVTTSDIIKKIINLDEIKSKLDNKSMVLFYTLVTGFSHFNSGQNEEAIVEYDKAIEINPRYASTYDNKGYSLFLLGRISEAIESASESIRLFANYANAWYNRAGYYSHDNKIEESLSDLQKAITIDAKYRDYALQDKDFDNMRNNAKFMEILRKL